MRKKLGLSLLSLLLALVAAELGFRLLGPALGVDPLELAQLRAAYARGDHGTFAPKAYVGYSRNPALEYTNRLGFAGPEYPVQRTPGVPRIACVGSAVVDPDTPRDGFPRYLARVFAEQGREVQVLDWTVPGWTSAETLINYLLDVQDYGADVVVIQQAYGDVEPRLWPDLKPDYSHYREPWRRPRAGRLERLAVYGSDLYAAWRLRSGPPPVEALVNREPPEADAPAGPETRWVYERNLRTLCEEVLVRGSSLVLVTVPAAPAWREEGPRAARRAELLAEHNQLLRELAAELGATLVDADQWVLSLPEETAKLIRAPVYSRSDGEHVKASLVAQAIQGAGALER